jgi:hypothetical protein
MQLMTWMMSRLGSRFALTFEPQQRRVMHSALGRFLDQPLDLKVGLVEPDGTQRVLPLTRHGEPLHGNELFDRPNSVTFRGFSEKYGLRFEFNVHALFYPQDERLCTLPAFYLEMRVNPAPRVRWIEPVGPTPSAVKLFIELERPDTDIQARHDPQGPCPWRIDLRYANSLEPVLDFAHPTKARQRQTRQVAVAERIVSLNDGCAVTASGRGLMLELPVTASGSGVKWRLIWAAHCSDPVLSVTDPHRGDAPARPGRFRYVQYWKNVDQVIAAAIAQRDDWLALSRRYEKIIEQAPLDGAQRHLLNQAMQNWLSNTFWCDLLPPPPPPPETPPETTPTPDHSGGDPALDDPTQLEPWFSVWEGNCFFHSTLDVEYNVALVYLTLWPQLLALQLHQWARFDNDHPPSGGAYLSHDLGAGPRVQAQSYPHPMEVEENCNYLLLLQAYAHWTGDLESVRKHVQLIQRLARYLVWTDRDGCGFPSEGVANTIDDASPALQYARKQTYLAIKRCAALRAAADLLARCDRIESARTLDRIADVDLVKIDAAAWLGDHYAVCVDKSATGVTDVWTGQPLATSTIEGWDAYSIYATNATLLPTLIGQPDLLKPDRVVADISNATRECLGRYGCGHSSAEPENVWVSQNLWRDLIARYHGYAGPSSAAHYWDLQVLSNTSDLSKGFNDTYANNNLCFYPRGITAIGYFLAFPRLSIDRLAPAGAYITVEPDRHHRQRWPLLPLADWKAGKVPVCVVDERGRVAIEGQIETVIIHGSGNATDPAAPASLIG